MLPPLDVLLALAPADRLALGSALARALGPRWRAGESLVGALGMIELVHASGHAFVAVGSARFEQGLRGGEREALVSAMLGPPDEGEDEDDRLAEWRAVEREIPAHVMAPAIVEVPGCLIGREPLPVARARGLGGALLQDLGYPEALGTTEEWGAFVAALPDGLRLPAEAEWELVAREGGASSWVVPMSEHGFPGMWPPREIFALENALGVRGMAIGEVFSNGYRRGVGDGRGNWGGPSGNAELHAAARWLDGFGASRLARSL